MVNEVNMYFFVNFFYERNVVSVLGDIYNNLDLFNGIYKVELVILFMLLMFRLIDFSLGVFEMKLFVNVFLGILCIDDVYKFICLILKIILNKEDILFIKNIN